MKIGFFTSHYVQIKPTRRPPRRPLNSLYIPLRSDKTCHLAPFLALPRRLYIPLRSDKTGAEVGAMMLD